MKSCCTISLEHTPFVSLFCADDDAIPTSRSPSPASPLPPSTKQPTMPTLIEQIGTGVITGDKVCPRKHVRGNSTSSYRPLRAYVVAIGVLLLCVRSECLRSSVASVSYLQPKIWGPCLRSLCALLARCDGVL